MARIDALTSRGFAMLILASAVTRLSRLRKRVVGYNGRGRRNQPTNGHTPPVSSMAGFHRTLLNAYIPTSATTSMLWTFICDVHERVFELTR